MFFSVILATNNCFLITARGCDCYVAICKPLRYTVLMNKGVCATLVCVSFGTGLVMAVLHIMAMFNLPFCGIYPVMKLSCIDININEIINYGVSSYVIFVPVGLFFTSCILLISSILKIPTTKGWKKSFATCASHLTVVMVHYGCASIAYLKPKSENANKKIFFSL